MSPLPNRTPVIQGIEKAYKFATERLDVLRKRPAPADGHPICVDVKDRVDFK